MYKAASASPGCSARSRRHVGRRQEKKCRDVHGERCGVPYSGETRALGEASRDLGAGPVRDLCRHGRLEWITGDAGEGQVLHIDPRRASDLLAGRTGSRSRCSARGQGPCPGRNAGRRRSRAVCQVIRRSSTTNARSGSSARSTITESTSVGLATIDLLRVRLWRRSTTMISMGRCEPTRVWIHLPSSLTDGVEERRRQSAWVVIKTTG